jgi:hypothetical protein
MGDWRAFVALMVVTVVAGLVWRMLSRLPRPRTPGWGWQVLAWLVMAVLVGPVFGATVRVFGGMLLRADRFLADPVTFLRMALGASLFFAEVSVIVAVMFAPLYAVVLLLWARLGPRLGRLETTHGGLLVSAGVLALPATLGMTAVAALRDRPFANQPVELTGTALTAFIVAMVSLWMPRRVFPGLRPGTFAGPPCVVLGSDPL